MILWVNLLLFNHFEYCYLNLPWIFRFNVDTVGCGALRLFIIIMKMLHPARLYNSKNFMPIHYNLKKNTPRHISRNQSKYGCFVCSLIIKFKLQALNYEITYNPELQHSKVVSSLLTIIAVLFINPVSGEPGPWRTRSGLWRTQSVENPVCGEPSPCRTLSVQITLALEN